MKKLYSLLLAVLFFLSIQVEAQNIITPTSVDRNTAASLSGVFKNYSLFNINTAVIAQYAKANSKGSIDLTLNFENYPSLSLSIYEHDILTSDYQVLVGTSAGNTAYGRPACITYTGQLTNDNSSSVYLTIADDLICGLIRGNGKEYFIEPLSYFNRQADPNTYVLYETKDVIPHSGFSCGVSEVESQKDRHPDSNTANKNTGTATGTCKTIEVAIASDDSMLYKYNTVSSLQQHNISIWNVVNGVYSNAQFGSEYFEFRIVGQYISTSLANNPLIPNYQGQIADSLLPYFDAWGQAGHFGFTYDIGELWTTRDIASGGSNGVIGLAYVGATCTPNRYQLIQDFSSDAASQASCIAHETGHNLGANHDPAGAPYIMAPNIANPPNTSFSPLSMSDINTYLTAGNGNSCFSACNTSLPVAQFNSSVPGICTNGSLTFTDYSTGQETSRTWSFPGGTPSSSTNASQSVTYTTPGLKTITLTAFNTTGSTAISKTVFVGNALTASSCGSYTTPDTASPVLLGFSLAGIGHSSNIFSLSGTYNDFSCTYNTQLQTGTTYSATINAGLFQPPYDYTGKPLLFIDYNNDGDFLDAGEAITPTPVCGQGIVTYSVTTPASITATDVWLRLRLVVMSCYQSTLTDGCAIPSNAQIEDYAVYFPSATTLSIKFISFNGYNDNNSNQLSWQTIEEHDNDYFNVERSTDGIIFTNVGKVNATGSFTQVSNYRFTDDLLSMANDNRFYYRLKTVAKDASYTYSNTIVLNRPAASETSAVIYPNPVTRGTSLYIKTANDNQATITIFNNLGQLLYTGNGTGNMNIPIPSNWTSGLYLVKVSGNRENISKLILVQ